MEQNFDYYQSYDLLNSSMDSDNSSSSINEDYEERNYYYYNYYYYFYNYMYYFFTKSNYNGTFNDFLNTANEFYEYYTYIQTSSTIADIKMRDYIFVKFLQYTMPIIVCLSFIGNLLIIIVVAPRRNKSSSTTAIYFCSLAVADLLVNCTTTLSNYLMLYGHLKLTYSTMDCKLRNIVSTASFPASVWQLVVISTERAICVITPHKVKLICTVKTAKAVVAAIWTVSLLTGVYTHGITYAEDFMGNEGLRSCQTYKEMKTFHQYYLVVYNIMFFFLPVILIIVSTVIIVSVLTARKLAGSKTTSISHVTVTLIALNVLFLLTQGPHHILILLEILGYFPEGAPIVDVANKVLATNVSIFLRDFNSSVNFFVYFLSGSKFRNDIMRLFKPKSRSITKTTSLSS